MQPATSKQLADRDPLVGALGWRAVLLYGDPCTFDRWAWVHRRSLGGPVRTLDAGSGNGAFAMYAASRGNEVTALSYLEDDQAKARRRATAVGLTQIDFRVGDLRELDRLSFDLGQFDQVFCLEVIEHILDDRKVLRDLAAVIRPGGRLLLTTPYRHHVPFFGEQISDHEDGHHLRVGYTHEEMEAMLVEAGFQPPANSFVSGRISQAGFNLMYRLNRIYPHLGWGASLPFRLLRPIDGLVTRATGYPHLSIGVVAIRA